MSATPGCPCSRLRTKMYYVLGRDVPEMRDAVHEAQYWCGLTATALGPDGAYCSPRICDERRSCYRQDEFQGP